MSSSNQIYKAIPAIMKAIPHIGKESTNNAQKYNFRSIDAIYNTLHKFLAEHEVFITKEILSMEREERKSGNDRALLYTILTVKFTYHASDGSCVSDTAVGEAMDFGDKASNKAMSAAYKYSLMQVFCIPTEEEKDTELQDYTVKPKEVKQVKRQQEDDGVAASEKQKDLIRSICKSHVFKNDKKVESILNQLDSFTIDRASKAISFLKDEQKTRLEIEKSEAQAV